MKPEKRIHVLHISTKQEIEFLRDHKDVASCEATPHHLTLVGPDCYERLGTCAQMNPPVRSADHRDGIWRGIEQGNRRRARPPITPRIRFKKRPNPIQPRRRA